MNAKINYSSILLVLAITLPFTSFAQYADSDLGHDGFMGAVKSAKITAYTVIEKDGEITRGDNSRYQIRSYTNSGSLVSVVDYSADGAVLRTLKKTFDEGGKLLELTEQMGEMIMKREVNSYDDAGNLIEKITYTGDGSINKKVSNIYNSKNQLVEKAEFSMSFGELYLSQKTIFEYNKSGKIEKESYLGLEGESFGSGEWKFDSECNEIEWLNLTETGEIKIRQTSQYNDKNILIVRKSFDKDGALTSETNLDHYGQPLTIIRYDPKGNILQKSGNRFDQFGNIVAELRYSPDGTESVNIEHQYTYDDTNNWIEQITYQNGSAVYIAGHEITYY